MQEGNLAIFDLDGTITRRDTLVPFIAGFLWRHPWRLWRWVPCLVPLLRYATGQRDRGALKSSVIQLTLGGVASTQLAAWAVHFTRRLLQTGLYAEALECITAHQRSHDHLVLLSFFGEITKAKITVRQLQGLRNILDTYAKLCCFQPVDLHKQLRFIEFQIDIHVLQHTAFVCLFEELRDHSLQFIEIVVLENKLHGLPAATVHLDSLLLLNEHTSIRKCRQGFLKRVYDLFLGAMPVFRVDKRCTRKTTVRSTPATTAACSTCNHSLVFGH